MLRNVEDKIEGICNKYNMPYGFSNNGNIYNNDNFNISPSIQELFSPLEPKSWKVIIDTWEFCE